MGRIPINIADHVGRTPMVQLSRLAPDAGGELFAKLEMYNPGGSVKDRIGVAMVDAAEAAGEIEPGRTTIVEATSGNTGIALAFVAAARGYDIILTLPQGMSREREGLLRLYGAQVHVTESLGGMNEAVAAAQALAREDDVLAARPVLQPRQPARPLHGHRPGDLGGDGRQGRLARRRRRDGRDDHRHRPLPQGAQPGLPRRGRRAAVVCVLSGGDPGPHKIQGIGAGFVPPVLDRDVVDEIIPVDDEDALETARLTARREGVLAGISCGAALWAATQIAAPARGGAASGSPSSCPTRGERYVSTPFFAPEPVTRWPLTLDIRELRCPLTWVRTKLTLERWPPGRSWSCAARRARRWRTCRARRARRATTCTVDGDVVRIVRR